MIFKALELLIQVEGTLIKPAVKMFNQCFTEMCEQKQRALNNQADEQVDCLQIISGFSMALGALIAGASAEELSLVNGVGRQLGGILNTGQHIPPAKVELLLDSLNCQSDRLPHFANWYNHHCTN